MFFILSFLVIETLQAFDRQLDFALINILHQFNHCALLELFEAAGGCDGVVELGIGEGGTKALDSHVSIGPLQDLRGILFGLFLLATFLRLNLVFVLFLQHLTSHF